MKPRRWCRQPGRSTARQNCGGYRASCNGRPGAAVSLVLTCLEQALTLARRQQAKAWELRAAISLGRLWQQQGKPREAATLLAPIYHQFTEGFATADLQEAKALLEALGG